MLLQSAEERRNRIDRFAVSSSHGNSTSSLKVDRDGSDKVFFHEVDGDNVCQKSLLKKTFISSIAPSFRFSLDSFAASNISLCHLSLIKVPAQIDLVLSQMEASVASCKSTS
jgi:hypothetical protein